MLSIKEVNRRFFESKLAEFVLDNVDLLTAVRQVSHHILQLIENETNLANLTDTIDENPKIRQDLYGSTMFGRITIEKHTSDEIINDIIYVLRQHDDLIKIMHIHALFVYRLFPQLIDRSLDIAVDNGGELNKSQHFTQQLQQSLRTINEEKVIAKTASLTAKNHPYIVDRGRKINRSPGKVYDRLGYSLPSFFRNKMSKTDKHIPGETLFCKDDNSAYCRLQSQGGVSFVAGSSGHSLSFIQGTLLYGALDNEQMKEYALAVFAYLAGGGNHSFHEVMSVFHLIVDMDYKAGEYTPSLPQSVLLSDNFYLKGHYRYSHYLETTPPSYLQKRWLSFFEEKKDSFQQQLSSAVVMNP